MTDYKLVPIPPTPEMVEAAKEAYMPFGDMDLAIRMAVLTAPDVRDEKPRQYPIGPLTYEKVFKVAGLTDLSDMKAVLDAVESALSASASPDVQGGVPEETISAVISLVKDAAAAHLNSEFGSCLSKIRKLLTAAPQPDLLTVDVLVEALERAHTALIGYLPGHRNDITDAAISQCEQVLAAYRKQGGVV